jgi:conjugal transfer ATP-binding protein TraC
MINFSQIQDKINQLLGNEAIAQKRQKPNSEFHLISDLLPYRSFDETKQIFINDNSVGFALEATPLIGANDNVIDTLSGMFSDALPEGCTIQFINFASPKVGPLFDAWKESRYAQGGIYKKLAEKRIAYFQNRKPPIDLRFQLFHPEEFPPDNLGIPNSE